MPARTDLQFVVLEDFSQGIHDDWFSDGGAGAAADGALQLDGTFGCVSARGGGLISAPRRVQRLQESITDFDAGNFPTDEAHYHITAFRCLSPVWDRTGVNADETGRTKSWPDILAYGFEWYFTDGGGTFTHNSLLRVYKMFQQATADPAIGDVESYDVATVATDPGYDTPFVYGFSSIDISRSNSADNTTPGYPYIGMEFTSNRQVGTFLDVAYPDDTDPGNDTTGTLGGLEGFGGFAAYALFAHQDRLFSLGRSVNVGIGPTGELPTEILTGTAVNNYTVNGIDPQQYVAENPSGFGSWCSMNSSEAIFIKQQFGGFVLRGAIETPTVVRLPGLEPTFEAINLGCISAKTGGYVYGSRNGVYMWSGGDTAAFLSSALNGWFWKVSKDAVEDSGDGILGVDNYLYTKGRFASFEQYVFAPNNFVLDIDSGGWWKLTDPDADDALQYAWWDVSAAGLIVGAPAYFDPDQPVIADYYDIYQGQPIYRATTQPLRVTRGRVVDCRELDLVAQGRGVITVTLVGLDGETDTTEFGIDSEDRPVTINQPCAMKSHDIVVVIDSVAHDEEGGTAPRMKRLALGMRESETAR